MSTMNENNLHGKSLQGTRQQHQQEQPQEQPQQQQQQPQEEEEQQQRSFFLYPPPAAPEYDGFSSYLMENLLLHRQHQQKFVYSSPPGINADAINFQHDPSYKLPTPPNFTGMYFEQKRLVVRTKRKQPSKPPPTTTATKKQRHSSSASFIRRNPQSTLNLIRKSNGQEKEKEIKTIKSYNRTRDSPVAGGEKEEDEEDDVPDNPHCKVWNDNYLLLKEYHKQHGHCNVPQRKEGQLGPWVKRQRGEYKRHKMRKNRIALLNEIGFVWNMKKDEQERKEKERGTFDPTAAAADNNNAKWLAQYKMLVKYRKRHKHCNVPQKDGQLGKWVNFQRHVYARNKMKEDRKKLLNKIGFVWKLR